MVRPTGIRSRQPGPFRMPVSIQSRLLVIFKEIISLSLLLPFVVIVAAIVYAVIVLVTLSVYLFIFFVIYSFCSSSISVLSVSIIISLSLFHLYIIFSLFSPFFLFYSFPCSCTLGSLVSVACLLPPLICLPSCTESMLRTKTS